MTKPSTGSPPPPADTALSPGSGVNRPRDSRGSQLALVTLILALIGIGLVIALVVLAGDRARLFSENTDLKSQAATLTSERDALQAQVAQLQERVTLLETAQAGRVTAMAEATNSRLNSLIDSLQRFRLGEGRYPAALGDLNRRDATGRPYRDPEVPLVDGWTRDFRYQVTAAADLAVLASAGPDHEFGTSDDAFVRFPVPARVEIGPTPQP